MDTAIVTALNAAIGSILIAALTYYLTKKQQIAKEWRDAKLNHYKVLMSALSDLAVDGTNKDEANMNFSLTVNTISLVAPQYVVTALMNFHDEIKFSNKNRTIENHDKLLMELLLAIRKDIKVSRFDNPKTFKFHLIGKAPKK